MKVKFYRGITIMTNTLDNGYKWTTLELEIFSNSVDGIKNKIDDQLGGYATGRKPKRAKNY